MNALFADYKVYHEPSMYPNGGGGKAPNWIITDVRFPNEAKAIKDRGGVVIRVNRPLERLGNSKLPKLRHTSITQHPSETALDDYDDFDYVIENDGTVQDLIDKVMALNIV